MPRPVWSFSPPPLPATGTKESIDSSSESEEEYDKNFTDIAMPIDTYASPTTSRPTTAASTTAASTTSSAEKWAAITDSVYDNLTATTITIPLLQELTGYDDLEEARELTLTEVDVEVTAVDGVGGSCPNVMYLRMKKCRVPSFREFGTGLKNLKVLWLSRGGVRDLSGVFGLPSLKELYLSFNNIDTLDDLSMHPNLQVLDLEANQIKDFNECDHLATIPTLTSLTLVGNPVHSGGGSEEGYRLQVCTMISSLEVLDDVVVGMETSFCATPVKGTPGQGRGGVEADEDPMFFTRDDAHTGANTSTTTTAVGDEDLRNVYLASRLTGTVTGNRPSRRPSTARVYRGGDAYRGGAEYGAEEADTQTADDDAAMKQTRLLNLLELEQFDTQNPIRTPNKDDAGSNLTHGTSVVFAGSASKSLRNFHESPLSSPSHVDVNGLRMIGHRKATSEQKVAVEYEVAGDREEFSKAIEELKSWRMARSKGWQPGGDEDWTLKVKEKAPEIGATRAGIRRPGTAPGGYDGRLWQRPLLAAGAAGTEQAREELETPSSKSEVGGLTPRHMEELEEEEEEERARSRAQSSLSRLGEGVGMTDDELVALLSKKPKLVAFLKTRNSFRKFFRGMPVERMRRLLTEAYKGLGEEECETKVKKRLRLFEGGETDPM